MNNVSASVRIYNEPVIINDLYNDKDNTHAVVVGDCLDLFFENKKSIIEFAEELINKTKEMK